MRLVRNVRLVWTLLAVVLVVATGVAIAQTVPATEVAVPATQPIVLQVVTTAPAAPVTDSTVTGATKLITDKFNHLTVEQIFDPGFWRQFLLDTVRWTIGFIPRLIVACFLMAFFWLIYRIVRKVILGSMRAAGVDESIRDMLSHLLKWAVLGFGLIIAGNQIGLEIAALLTGVSIIGLAVGFAAQESLSNFIAGIMIFLDKPFKVGDWVVIEGHLAQVKRVTFRSTRMSDLDGDVVVMPNVQMLSNKLVNKSTNTITRCCVQVGIAYGASIEQTRGVLLKMVANDPRIEKMPPPRVDVLALSASSVDLELRFWIREEQFQDAMKHEYTERTKVALDAAGISIPFPHVQLLVEQTPAIEKLARSV